MVGHPGIDRRLVKVVRDFLLSSSVFTPTPVQGFGLTTDDDTTLRLSPALTLPVFAIAHSLKATVSHACFTKGSLKASQRASAMSAVPLMKTR